MKRCTICGKYFKSLGIASHRAACYRKAQIKHRAVCTEYEVQVKQMDYYNYSILAYSEEEAIKKVTEMHNKLVDEGKQECDDSDMDVYIY